MNFEVVGVGNFDIQNYLYCVCTISTEKLFLYVRYFKCYIKTNSLFYKPLFCSNFLFSKKIQKNSRANHIKQMFILEICETLFIPTIDKDILMLNMKC